MRLDSYETKERMDILCDTKYNSSKKDTLCTVSLMPVQPRLEILNHHQSDLGLNL